MLKKVLKYIIKSALVLILSIIVTEIILYIASLILSRNKEPYLFNSDKEKIIFCIGDSFTYGQGLSSDESYPSALNKLLNEHGITNTEVFNLGLPGRSSSYALYTVASIVKECAKPSIIIVMSGWNANNNDFQIHLQEKHEAVPFKAKINNKLDNFRLYRLFRHLFTIKKREIYLDSIQFIPMTGEMSLYNFVSYQEICLKNLSKIVLISKKSHVPIIFLNYPYQDLPKNTFNLKNEYYHLIFGRTPLKNSDYLIPSRSPNEIAINSVIRYVAKKENVPFIDINAAFIKSKNKDLFQKDWHHPNAIGANIIANEVYNYLTVNNLIDQKVRNE